MENNLLLKITSNFGQNVHECSPLEVKNLFHKIIPKSVELAVRINNAVDVDNLEMALVEIKKSFNKPISVLQLGSAINYILRKSRIMTLKKLIEHTSSDLLNYELIGLETLSKIRAKLESFGLKLKGD